MRLIKPLLMFSIPFLLILSACGGQAASTQTSPEVIYTSAAQTVAAQLTETAISWTPTPEVTATYTPATPAATLEGANTPSSLETPTSILFTPFPSPTTFAPSTPSGPLCDDSLFLGDTTIPDGTKMKPGEQFYKIWRLKNTGVCTWDDGYMLAFAYGDPMGGQSFMITRKIDFAAPGDVKDYGIHFVAPTKPGTYTGCWRMMNDRGYYFGGWVCVSIEVVKK